jgi:hypothetical protein
MERGRDGGDPALHIVGDGVKSLGAAVAICAFLYFGPGLLEGSPTPCGALAMQSARASGSPLTALYARYAGDAVVAAQARKFDPSTPPEITCAVHYWCKALGEC